MNKSAKRSIISVTAFTALAFFTGSSTPTRLDLTSFPLAVQAGELAGDGEDACDEPLQAASPTASPATASVAGGDIVPVRSVQDPYPSLHSVSVDAENNLVALSDSNRGSLLVYDRTSGTSSQAGAIANPVWQVRGPATGMMFVAGVAMDSAHRELFAVNNDIGDRMEVFPYDVEGNVKPKRVLFVPHGSWGVSLGGKRDELAISVEHINSVVVYRREAAAAEAPLRVIHGAKTGLGDPHGIVFDAPDSEIMVANHGNWAPLTRAEASEGELKGGRFQLPSITTYSASAEGDATPTRTIAGNRTELNWPMGMGLDAAHDEIAVASYGNNSILVFHRTDNGNVAPARVIRGNHTGILGPMGVAIDSKNDELWVTNYRDHSALVFARNAQGDVAPKRVLRNASAGTPAVGFGNPGAVAYDSKRGEILVPN
jgi:DNA-binding beta-propeller fold protein YncE